MLKNKITIGLASFAFLMLISQIAVADITRSFTDTTIYWDGYGPNGDSGDTVGEPNISGGSAIFDDDGYLIRVEFDFAQSPGWEFTKMEPGDLFLDVDADGDWDYVMSSYNHNDNANEVNKYIPTSDVALYSTDGGSLLITGPDDPTGGYWDGYLIRNGHPFAYTNLNTASLGIGTASITGGYYNDSPVTFNMPRYQLPFETLMTIGFTENCANDVILATIEVPPGREPPPEVPEPSTLILLGLGLTGVAAYRKLRS